jgi:hypothetical protein
MLNPKPSDYKDLLEVFRTGLIHGIISRQEIIAWSDAIIIREEEPDYFFIELSLCSDNDRVISVIVDVTGIQGSLISIRVLFGALYNKVISNAINPESAIRILEGLNNWNLLTSFESSGIYSFDEYADMTLTDCSKDELTQDVLAFLSKYKELNFNNFQQWAEINSNIIGDIETEEIKAKEYYDILIKEYNKKNQAAKRKKSINRGLFYLFMITPLLLIMIGVVKFHTQISESNLTTSITAFALICGIQIFNAIYKKANED